MDYGNANLLLISDDTGDKIWLEQSLGESPFWAVDQWQKLSLGVERRLKEGEPADLLFIRCRGDIQSGLTHLRSLVGTSRPVVILVNKENEEDGLAALDLGADDYLIPAETTGPILMRLIRHLLRHRANAIRAEQAAEESARQTLLRALSISLIRVTSPEAIHEVILDGLEAILQVAQCAIVLLENEATEWLFVAARPESLALVGQRLPIAGHEALHHVWREAAAYTAMDDPFLGGSGPGREQIHTLIVPILIYDNVVGAIYCGRHNHFSPAEIETAQHIANLLGNKVEKLKLLAEVQRQVKELQILQDVALVGSLAVQEESLLQKATQIIGELLSPTNYGILLLNEATNTLQPHSTYQMAGSFNRLVTIPVGEGITGTVAATGRVWQIPDVHQVDEYLGLDPSTQSELCAPLAAGQRLIGVINVESSRLNAFSANDAQFLTTLGSQIATALEKIRLLESERHGRREAEILREAAKAVASTLNLNQVLNRVLLALEQVIRFDSAEIFLADKDGLQLVASRGWPANQKFIGQYYPADDDLFLQLRQSRQPICLADVQRSESFHFWGHTYYIRAWMGIPLVIDNQVIGVLMINSQNVNAYGPDEATLAQAFTYHVAMAVKNARLFESVQRYSRDLELVSKVLHCLNASPDIAETFSVAASHLRTVSGCFRISLTLLDERQEQFYFQVLEQPGPSNSRRISWPISASTAANDILAGRIHITADLALEQEGVIEKLLYDSGQHSRINLPLTVNERVLGSLNLTWLVPAGFDLEQLPLLMQVADAMALAVERSRLLTQVQGNLTETRALYRISRSLIAIEDSDHLLQRVVENVAEVLPAGLVIFIVFADNDGAIDKMAVGGSEQSWAKEITVEQLQDNPILQFTKPTLWAKEENDTRPGLTQGSLMVANLNYRQKSMGLLIAANQPNMADFTLANLDLLVAIAHQVAIVLDNVYLLEETKQHKQELETLVTFSADLRSQTTLNDLLSVIVHKSVTLVNADQGCILLLDEQNKTLVRRAITPNYHGILGEHLPLQRGISGYVMETGLPYVTNDLRLDPLAHVPSTWQKIKGSITLPLRTQESLVGVINIGSRHDSFTPEQCRLLTAIADIAGNAIQRAIIMETLEQRVKERTSALAQANEQLKALDRVKTQFISDVSHELRTPITNLSLYLDLLERGRPEKNEQYWGVLRKQSDRLTLLIEDVLSLSRLELRNVKTDLAMVDLNQVVEQVLAALRSMSRLATLEVCFKPDLAASPIWGDANQLSQMITRMMTNAVNYTPAGGHIEIGTLFEAINDRLCLQIKDSGVGISQEDLPHIFDRFYRGQSASQLNIPGNGLGLAIVKEIVHLHSGTVEIESQLGLGTTFRVWLSVEPVQQLAETFRG